MKTHQVGISLGSVLSTWRERKENLNVGVQQGKGKGHCEDSSHRNTEEQELRNPQELLVGAKWHSHLGELFRSFQ